MDPFLEFDLKLFKMINQDWSDPLGDFFFPKLTDLHQSPVFWGFIVVLLVMWIAKQRFYAVKWILFTMLCVGLSDQICYHALKPMVHRSRPEQSGIPLIVRGQHHEGNSFPSNHAANCFAAATALSFTMPLASPVFFSVAALVGYSRVYVGAHFPSDVLAGAALGIVLVVILRILLARLLERPTVKVVEAPRRRRPGANRWA